MTRKTTRGEQRAQRRAAWWAEQMAAAATPRAQAVLTFNWLQARVKDLPPGEQDAVWRALTDEIHALAARYLHAKFAREIRTDPSPTRPALYGHAATRTRAREGASA
jgi:hypothetical protein